MMWFQLTYGASITEPTPCFVESAPGAETFGRRMKAHHIVPQLSFAQVAAIKLGSPQAFLPLHSVISPFILVIGSTAVGCCTRFDRERLNKKCVMKYDYEIK